MNDLERFMRSPEGIAHLAAIRDALVERTVIGVDFINNVHAIAIELVLNDGTHHQFFEPTLEVDAVRDQFAKVLEREYYVDFPERKPPVNNTK